MTPHHESMFDCHSLRDPQRAPIRRILAAALNAVDPYRCVRETLRVEGNRLSWDRRDWDLNGFSRITVLGAGKAVLPMARATLDVLGERVQGGHLIAKTGHARGQSRLGPLSIREASHPLPDQEGVNASRELLEAAQAAQDDDLVVVLISGGCSALLVAPEEGTDLDSLRGMTSELLACGASIHEINGLRRNLDRVKGGGLARAAHPATVIALILSDVVGNDLSVIGSGPTVENPMKATDALAVLDSYGLRERIEPSILTFLEGLPRRQENSVGWDHVVNVLVASNETAVEGARVQAVEEGMACVVADAPLIGEARTQGARLADFARKRSLSDRARLVLHGGETTVTLQGNGRGGRNQELALAAVEPMTDAEGVTLVALATDGEDGPTDAAGAVVTAQTESRGRRLGLGSPAAFLERNDSYHYFEGLDDLLRPGSTGTNVGDLALVFFHP